jgi:chromosome segregation ATPase
MDEIDIISRNEALEKQNEKLAQDIEKLKEQMAVMYSNTDLVDQITTLESAACEAKRVNTELTADLEQARANLCQAQADLSAANEQIDALKASQAAFDKAVAAKVADLGISSQAVGGDPSGGEKTMSWTDRARAAKGQD